MSGICGACVRLRRQALRDRAGGLKPIVVEAVGAKRTGKVAQSTGLLGSALGLRSAYGSPNRLRQAQKNPLHPRKTLRNMYAEFSFREWNRKLSTENVLNYLYMIDIREILHELCSTVKY
jgi:hypothetical protein